MHWEAQDAIMEVQDTIAYGFSWIEKKMIAIKILLQIVLVLETFIAMHMIEF